jgi:hypothetical protein
MPFHKLTRRAALTALGAGAVVGLAYVLRGLVEPRSAAIRLTDDGGGMMGVSAGDMSLYMDMFDRHNELSRTVEDIPGGVCTTTQSDSPELAAQLKAHVSSMYSHLEQGAEVMCMSDNLPTLFRQTDGYRRQLTFTSTGVIAEETSNDPELAQAIRAHAREVTGFVRDGMPPMMQGMMGGSGGMMGPPDEASSHRLTQQRAGWPLRRHPAERSVPMLRNSLPDW